MAQGRRPPRRRCQRRARGGCGATGAPRVPRRESGAAGCRHAQKSRAIAPSRSVSLPARQATAPCGAQFARALTFLTVITALVLVVACTNFTNLMFARAEARRREFLIRLALGGGRWRLIREVRGRMPGACRDCRRAGAAVRRLGDVDGDEPRLGARAARAARLRDRVEHARDGVCRRLRLHRRAVRPVAVHAAGAFDRDLLGASPHRRRWRASGREPDHAHRPACCLRHPDVRRRPAPPDGHQPAHAGPGIRARCAPDSDRSRTSWPSAGRCFRAGGRSAAADRDDPGRAGGRRLRIGAPRLRRVLGGWERAAADRSRRGCGRHQVDVCVRRTGLLRRRRHASGAGSAVVGDRASGRSRHQRIARQGVVRRRRSDRPSASP